MNIGKVTNKFLKTGNASWNGTGDSSNGALGYSKLQHQQDYRPEDYSNRHQNKSEITEDKAKQWEGWGTALKPAHEPICMARKPLAEKTVAENCLKYGTGGINIDESRVESNEVIETGRAGRSGASNFNASIGEEQPAHSKRFPANLIHDNSEEVRECFPESTSGARRKGDHKEYNASSYRFGGLYSKDVPAEKGNASRFFKSIIYQAKASKSERNKGCEELEEKVSGSLNFRNPSASGRSEDAPSVNAMGGLTQPKANNHPTVKPIALMEYLIKMVTRE